MLGVYLATVLAVTDGDTFKGGIWVWKNVQVVTAIRIKGIDTPELKGKCEAEIAAAQKAKARLTAIVAGQDVTVENVTNDKYGSRVDAIVRVKGKSVGDMLVSEGLARPYEGGKRAGWCP